MLPELPVTEQHNLRGYVKQMMCKNDTKITSFLLAVNSGSHHFCKNNKIMKTKTLHFSYFNKMKMINFIPFEMSNENFKKGK